MSVIIVDRGQLFSHLGLGEVSTVTNLIWILEKKDAQTAIEEVEKKYIQEVSSEVATAGVL